LHAWLQMLLAQESEAVGPFVRGRYMDECY
jgi:hypothetical protein